MGIGLVSRSFCAVCGTGSHTLEDCPGGLHATGADRPGWRASRPTGFAAAVRKSKSLPVRLSLDRVITRGVTVNLSVEGMFVGVASPVDCGRSLLIHLDLDGHTLPLRGLVMWNRADAQPAYPAGMGIRLSDPTPLYQSLVAGLPSA